MFVRRLTTSIFIISVVIAAGIFFSSCEKDIQISKEEEFIEYVSAYTTGIISRESTIKVRLVQAYQESESNEISPDLKLLKFDPQIEGETYWLDNQTIEFSPKEKLEPDTKYFATFDVGKAIKSEKKIEPFIFEFQTIKRQLEVEVQGLTALSTKTTEYQKLTGKVETSDFEDLEEIKKILNAEFEDESIKISWFPGTDRKQHKFELDSLIRGDNVKDIIIEWDGSPIGIDDSGTKTVNLPPLYEFNVSAVKVIHMPDQYISLTFTDPLNRTQNLDGLITIDNVANLRYEANYNEVKIYPPQRLYGEYSFNVNQGVKNSLNYKMKANFKSILVFENLKPAVKLIGQGVIIPENKHGFVLPI